MENSIYICHCKMVTRSEIAKAIKGQGCQTILDIQNTTGASTGCGRCKSEVVEIMINTLAKIKESNRQLRLPF